MAKLSWYQVVLQEVHGRTVTVLQHSGKVYAVDTSCFHQGGPLGTQGDIEDINGVACIRCPWHGYRVSNRLALRPHFSA